MAILLGFLLGQFLAPSARTKPGLKYAEKTVLALAIGLLGARLDVSALAELGWPTAVLIFGMMVATIAGGVLLARALGLGEGLGWTLGVGTAVCGSSAIAAAAPFVDAEEEEVALSVGVVNLLGTVGIFVIPALVFALSAPTAEGIVLAGGSLHAVGHVVAAADAISEQTVVGATAVKMGRIALLVPVVLFLATRQQRRRGDAGQVAGGLHKLLPGYLLAFLLLATLNSLGWLPQSIGEPLRVIAKLALAIAMAGIGLQLQLKVLLRQGPRALLAGVLLWAGQIAFLLAGMKLL